MGLIGYALQSSVITGSLPTRTLLTDTEVHAWTMTADQLPPSWDQIRHQHRSPALPEPLIHTQ